MFAVTVILQIDPAQIEAFMPLMLENAQSSLGTEPGCRRFDVCRNADAPNTVFLYELYDSKEAFDAHLASAHFKSFDSAVGKMVTEKDVSTWDTVTA